MTKKLAAAERFQAESPLMTIAEAAAYLRATPSWIRKLIAAGSLPYQPQGKQFLVLRSDLDAYIQACRDRRHSPNIVQTVQAVPKLPEHKGT